MLWRTKFTQLFPCKLPIMGAPMANVSGGRLAAETARAGALGFLAAGHLTDLESLQRHIQEFRHTASPEAALCIGFISHSALGNNDGNETWERFETVLAMHTPQVVQFFAPSIVTRNKDKKTNVDVAHHYGCKVLVQVGSVEEAKKALQAGVDGLIAQGSEAGGHGLRRELGNGTLPLAARIVSLVSGTNIPVLAAGGIVDGRGVAAALALGCDGAVLGTRLWATEEALGHDSFKRVLASPDTGPDQVIRSTVPDQIENSYSQAPWPQPYDSLGFVRNETLDAWEGQSAELAAALNSQETSDIASRYRDAKAIGDPSVAAVHSGQGVGDIETVMPAYDIIMRINDEAMTVVKNMTSLLE